ncbi:hypothetical protein ABZX85_49195 [Streptomyces sp. NPDC004539]|uniref:hypothetical protein n=1 Tax=Streptomyces sp. NPDC004539 TaxID=3154280 RepID=UPI00339FA13B
MAFVGVDAEVESAWVRLASAGSADETVLSEEGTQTSPFALQYNHPHTGGPGWALAFTDADTASPTTAYTYAATRTAQLYVDGALAATTTGVTSWAATGAPGSAAPSAASRRTPTP